MDLDATKNIDIRSKVLQTTLADIGNSSSKTARPPEPDDCCVICLDVVTESCRAKPCDHTNFDFLCLLSWLENQEAKEQPPRCPLCNAEIAKVRYDFKLGRKRRLKWETYTIGTSWRSLEKAPNQRLASLPRRIQPPPSHAEDAAISRRREIHVHQLYSLHVGSNATNSYSVDPVPSRFRTDPDLVSRTRMFLRRELQAFDFLNNNPTARRAKNPEYLLEYIVAILKSVDIQGSQGQAEEMISEFLGRGSTRLLLHELKSYLRSPYVSLEVWDRHVQYPSRVTGRIGSDG